MRPQIVTNYAGEVGPYLALWRWKGVSGRLTKWHVFDYGEFVPRDAAKFRRFVMVCGVAMMASEERPEVESRKRVTLASPEVCAACAMLSASAVTA